MPNYVLSFHGEVAPMPDDPKIQEEMMAEWGAWYGSMGDALVDGGAPFGEATAINADGATSNPASMTGYTVVSAADMAAATAIAQGCPVIKNGHTVQICEAIDMS